MREEVRDIERLQHMLQAADVLINYKDNHTLEEAEDAGNLCVCLTFSDNTTQTVDIGDFIRRHPHPQYNKYLAPRKFSRFTIDNGNVVWGKNWDLIFPVEQLYAGKIA